MNTLTTENVIEQLRQTVLAVEGASLQHWTEDDVAAFRYHLGMLDSQFHIVNGDKDKLKQAVAILTGRG